MALKNRLNKTITSLLCTAMVLIVQGASAQEYIPEPEYSRIDENNVDTVGGKLTLTAPGVTIGSGELSLHHTLSSYSGDFISTADNYNGASIYNVRRVYGNYDYIRYIVARTPAGMIRFRLNENNQYVGMDNSQGSVEEVGNDFNVTYPDGTIAKFYRIDNQNLKNLPQISRASAKILQDSGGGFQEHKVALLKELIDPNGYTVVLHRVKGVNNLAVTSVTTNTGLQLKYKPFNRSGSEVYAINNAISYCSRSYTESCDYQGWPNVRYQWTPSNITELIVNNVESEILFSVRDMAGLTTKYHHSPFDANLGANNRLYPLDRSYVWRITKIVEPSGRTTQYSYENRIEGGIYAFVAEKAVLWRVFTDTYSKAYVLGHGIHNYAWRDSNNYIRHFSSTYRGTELVYNTSTGALVNAFDAYDNTFYIFNYEHWNNEVTSTYSPQGTFRYYYDDNKHLIKRTHQVGVDENASENIDLIARYPSTCNNRKICNKPTQLIDGEGKATNFEYHPKSGQIAKITKPAGSNGIRPETRYTYQQKYAWYKNSLGNLQRAKQPIWLLTRESTCQEGAARGNGCANSNDEVIMTYEYGRENEPNNLFLTGMTITADGQTRRTCYENDVYGNRISEIRPKGAGASCP